jgi:rod shape-determining protein MreD
MRLIAFAPFFAIIFERSSYVKSLWIAVLCGLILDLFSSQLYFGLYGICYGITAAICYHQKKHFFEEKPLALSLYSALISSISSLALIVLTLLFDRQFPLTLEMIISDGFVTPILDALYAFVWFTVPIKVYLYLASGKWKKYFEKKEESL